MVKNYRRVREVFAGSTHRDKYRSGNPLSHGLVLNFLAEVLDVVEQARPDDIHEVGCGEGHVSGMLARNGFRVRGCDVSAASVATARRECEARGLHLPLEVKSVYDLDPAVDSASVVLCCEVLEHLTDPGAALDRLLSITRKSLILSVPREPVWHLLNMARGKYLHALGNTPGHYQHWSRRMFVEFVSSRADIVSVRTPLPWTIVHCTPRRGVHES